MLNTKKPRDYLIILILHTEFLHWLHCRLGLLIPQYELDTPPLCQRPALQSLRPSCRWLPRAQQQLPWPKCERCESLNSLIFVTELQGHDDYVFKRWVCLNLIPWTFILQTQRHAYSHAENVKVRGGVDILECVESQKIRKTYSPWIWSGQDIVVVCTIGPHAPVCANFHESNQIPKITCLLKEWADRSGRKSWR